MKKLVTWVIITGCLAVVFFALTVVTAMSFFGNVTSIQDGEQLISGATVHITEEGPHRIYLEDRVPPVYSRHEFTFTNVATGERVTSRQSNVSSTYSFGNVHGRLSAVVDLAPGSYIIEFEPWEGSGVFVWGSNMFSMIFGGIMGIFGFGSAGMISLTLFIVFLVFYVIGRKKAANREVLHETYEDVI